VRLTTKYPPFSTIIRILVSGRTDIKIKEVLEDIMKDLRGMKGDSFLYLGAMKCPRGRLQNKFRYEIIARVKTNAAEEIIDRMDGIIKKTNARGNQIFLEINPSNLS
jgi:primosomal protein N'